MTPHGMKTKAGQLLTQYLRQISEEMTEVIKDPKTGEDRMATKAEALARKIWRDALGYAEIKVKDNQAVEFIVAPSRAAQSIVFDRIEGRAPLSVAEGADKLTAAKKVSEEGKKRISEAGKTNVSSD